MSNLPSVPRSERVTLTELAPSKQRFVLEYVARAGGRRGGAVDAVQAAGISPNNRNAARVRASEFLRDPQILSVLRDEIAKKLGSAAVIGINVLIDLALNSTSQQIKFSAARELVDRGFGPVVSRTANVHANFDSIDSLIIRLDAQEAAAQAATIEGKVNLPAIPRDDEGDGQG